MCPRYHVWKHHQETKARHPAHYQGPSMTWPDLVLSMEQSGTILDSCTIQLLILSRRRRSTRGQRGGQGDSVRTHHRPRRATGALLLRHRGCPQPHQLVPTFIVLSPAFLIPSCPGSF